MNQHELEETMRLTGGRMPIVRLSSEDIDTLPVGTVLYDVSTKREVVLGERRLDPTEDEEGMTRYGLLLRVKALTPGDSGYVLQQSQIEGRDPSAGEALEILKEWVETLLEMAEVEDIHVTVLDDDDRCRNCGKRHPDPSKADLN